MITLPKNYKNELKLISSNGVEALIYTDKKKLYAYKIYRGEFLYNSEKFGRMAFVETPNFIRPLEPITIEGSDKIVGYNMKYIEGQSLPYLREASLDDLIKAAAEIANTVNNISDKQFMIWDANAQNILFDGNFRFIDTYTYAMLKNSIKSILKKWNIRVVNETILRGLIGFSYKSLITKYLAVVAPKSKLDFRSLNPFDEYFVYDVLSILRDITEQNSLDEAKLKILVPIYESKLK